MLISTASSSSRATRALRTLGVGGRQTTVQESAFLVMLKVPTHLSATPAAAARITGTAAPTTGTHRLDLGTAIRLARGTPPTRATTIAAPTATTHRRIGGTAAHTITLRRTTGTAALTAGTLPPAPGVLTPPAPTTPGATTLGARTAGTTETGAPVPTTAGGPPTVVAIITGALAATDRTLGALGCGTPICAPTRPLRWSGCGTVDGGSGAASDPLSSS